jgi:hypothetical protein
VADTGFSMSLPDCDNDVCGGVLPVIGLIVLTYILVIGLAFSPHFLILSGSLLIGIMLLSAIHDLRIRLASRDDPIIDS